MKCKKCGTDFEGRFCSNCGASAEDNSGNVVYNTPPKTEKTKKPFYKRGWFIAIAIICVLSLFSRMNNSNGRKNENIDWTEIELSEYMPEPEKTYGEITTNRSDLTMVTISKITKQDYKNYVQKCIDEGFNIDLEYEPWDTVYGAFDEDGYSIRIIYSEYSEEMSITFEIPETPSMKKIEWPTNELATVVPVPKSDLGNISWNNSTSFIVHLGNTTYADYNEYVKECEKQGFINDYSKGDKTYSAKNSDGYKLSLMYLGANVIEISIKAPEQTQNIPTSSQVENNTEQTEVTKPTENKKTVEENKDNGILSQDFKNAMDSYEKFIDEYVSFMKKYSNSNGTDMSLILDYSNYMSKYADMVKDFEKWENEDLNPAETAYYIDVQARVSKKLLEVAY